MSKRSKEMALVVMAVVLAAGPAATEFVQKSRAEEPPPAASAGAQSSWDAVALGRVEPQSREIKVGALIPTQIAEVLVKANEKVFAGELLIRLDDREALARVAAADAQVALHKRARNEQSAPPGSADRRKAEDALADAEHIVADARSELDRVTVEWRSSRAPQADLDAARAAVSRAQDRVKELQDALTKLKASPDTPLPTRAEGELNVARADWTLAQAVLEKTRIRAPIDGTVLQLDARKGEVALPMPEPAMLVLGDVSSLRVRAEVEEQYLGRLHVGQLAKIRAGAFRGREFAGKISSIAPIVGQGRINSRGPRKFNDVDVLEVLVDLPDPGPLVVGEQVDVYFSAESTETQ
jgi:HlyD family secretion protein